MNGVRTLFSCFEIEGGIRHTLKRDDRTLVERRQRDSNFGRSSAHRMDGPARCHNAAMNAAENDRAMSFRYGKRRSDNPCRQ
uniref:Uncharacterized protein n=1 Tax=Candidatus Kentrum sp. SD TaxID=2126332 RepID=A0A450YTB6_9GAMM|nr:MAG: hypothetical protein BECKSD772F_GA0070984_11964 [Candidatus Kentron sp. SD]VFK49609.1 MAG: hypothetical protein BECKSD772E_GA0070983_12004 [Candidatus Kentron sp. SD]